MKLKAFVSALMIVTGLTICPRAAHAFLMPPRQCQFSVVAGYEGDGLTIAGQFQRWTTGQLTGGTGDIYYSEGGYTPLNSGSGLGSSLVYPRQRRVTMQIDFTSGKVLSGTIDGLPFLPGSPNTVSCE